MYSRACRFSPLSPCPITLFIASSNIYGGNSGRREGALSIKGLYVLTVLHFVTDGLKSAVGGSFGTELFFHYVTRKQLTVKIGAFREKKQTT